MRSKHLLTVVLLLPSVTMSSGAIARQTYGHWQKTAALAEQRVPYARAEAEPYLDYQYPMWDSRLCTYQGGPKANSWACK